MRSSTRNAFVIATTVSLGVSAAWAVLAPSDNDMLALRLGVVQEELDALRVETAELRDRLVLLVKASSPAAMQSAAGIEEPSPLALTGPIALAAANAEAVNDAANSGGSAALEAVKNREMEQRRRLFVQRPVCSAPNAAGSIVCAVSIRNNALAALPVTLNQAGSKVEMTGGATFNSMRFRQAGQTVFSFSGALNVPGKSARILEISFGPVETPGDTVRGISLSVNKLDYAFDQVDSVASQR
jgi:hypothetical protein